MRILVVDDDPELADLLAESLGRDNHTVSTASDLVSAREALARPFDLLVLDLGLPDGSGLDLCDELRRSGQSIPILLLTAQSAVSQRVSGLNAGADDYVTKPFAVAELRARVRALGRRRANPPVALCQVGPVSLDVCRRRAHRDGSEVELTSREWDILEVLVGRAGRVVCRTDLLDLVWGDTADGAAASLEVLIGRIRRKLGREVVRTIRGVGYAVG